jgi:TPR repeat protein
MVPKSGGAGEANAMSNIGVLYDNGQGVAQDYAQAMQWYQKAAAEGNTNAMFIIGYFYQHGHGVAQDRDQAAQWWKKAAALGNQVAIDNLKRLGQ